MKTDLTILVENTTSHQALIGEWGFAALLNIDDHKLLFDTGQGDALFINSLQLGIPLEETEEIVISHGHFDHCGALLKLLKQIGPRPVTAHPRIFVKRYAVAPSGRRIEVGCPFSEAEAVEAGARFRYSDKPLEIYPGVYITGTIPRRTAYEDAGGRFVLQSGEDLIEDYIEDDMALVIDHPQGLIILSGCAHAGTVNTLEYAREITGKRHIQAYIGGTHLMNASSERMEATLSALLDELPDRIMIGHCTGFYPAAQLYQALGHRVVKIDAGSHFTFI
ncbi:MAG: MBL fold metallo-hydrolase [Syntrophomonadaceae bacterium]|nr:MBL fold metallo-hydrolase [Syntrophomonadaceae bacterium]